ncbi:MAG: glycosyltransferase family 4 protein [Clostridiaceae bacterium]|nr:glycosyltransferase family 4 protein [Clostridiaceae bacterium]
MNILMFSWEYPPRIIGGISRVVYHLSRGLSEQGHNVTVITSIDGEEEFHSSDNKKIYSVSSYYVKPINFINSVLQMNLSMFEKAVEIINNGEMFDIIHLHDWLVAFVGKSMARVYPIRQVCNIHSTEYGRKAGIHNEIQSFINNVEKKMVHAIKHVIVNSMYMKNEVNTLFDRTTENIHVIPNGIEPDRLSLIPRDMNFRKKYAQDNEKIVFFIGRLVNEKGVHVLMDAIPIVLSKYRDVRFIIAGSGPERDTLEKKAIDNGVADRVHFTGYIDDEELYKMYKCVDIAVFPSLYEPFGIVALEAMVANLPVVVSEAGGFNEIVTNRYNGMKFRTGRSDLLADCIIELLTSPELAAEITKNAWNTIYEKYKWSAIVEKTYAVYELAKND